MIEARNHINILGLMAVKLAILAFTKRKSNISIHPQRDDNKTVQNGGYPQQAIAQHLQLTIL